MLQTKYEKTTNSHIARISLHDASSACQYVRLTSTKTIERDNDANTTSITVQLHPDTSIPKGTIVLPRWTRKVLKKAKSVHFQPIPTFSETATTIELTLQQNNVLLEG